MKVNTATIDDVERAFNDFKSAAKADPALEGLYGKKLAAAVDALIPKSTVSAVFKRLQGNALRDFAVGKEEGKVDYSNDTKPLKMKEYVYRRFRSYMEDPKTSQEAITLFQSAYPPGSSEPAINNHALEYVQEEI